ncbi:MAG: Glycerol-3-phosphate acyltransferase [Candidatus Tokpelaia hoelldobleri]|uniref:Glycerol-3-phosphate acyltransferase n=1 Tax=Candidatus Tokpelaia hoelldobleri TaxID=1902579 RepID=A0A1U9JU46_9HYPH|nr:MAG: Glycerol-3-phosphate acyltransferase [Candidatus Tokpelaia hoelldoblerii]
MDIPFLPVFIMTGVLFFIGYVLGSIPFGLIFTRLAGLGDIRKTGSGNIGATNVLRTGHKKIAFATLLCDMLKGTAAVLAALNIVPFLFVALLAGSGAVIGHMFPVWLKFKGGKGVATYLGVLLGLDWLLAVVFGLAWLMSAFLTRYSSLAALVAVVTVPVAARLLLLSWPASLLLAVMSLLVILKHHANIRRLLNGTESKIGAKAG